MNQTEAARSNQVRYICDNNHSYNRIRLHVQLTEAIALSTFRNLLRDGTYNLWVANHHIF
jgi:hypothetical protein